MISLLCPKVGEDRYLFFNGAAFGPYDRLFTITGERINFRSTLETIDQKRGMYRENDVVHDKLWGNLYYYPLAGGCAPLATALLPCRLNVPVYDDRYPTLPSYYKIWRTADYGLAIDHGAARALMYVGSNLVVHQAYSLDPVTNKWTVWVLTATQSALGVVKSIYRYEIQSAVVVDMVTLNVKCRITQYTSTYGAQTARDWKGPQGFQTIVDATALFIPGLAYFQSFQTSSYRGRIPDNTVFSPAEIKSKIDMLVAPLTSVKFPIEDKHYGDLAMEATEGKLNNHTNMIAFLLDLRHPLELIPKLRNLQKLKTLADGYLTVKYGILPTIADIKAIIAAFKHVGPYLDSNGFTACTAGYREEVKVGELTYLLTQHIKVAVDNEDSIFQELTQRLESMGILPTFENLWDLVPYSFVLDWIIDVGGLLERVDTRLRLSRLNIRYATMSRKTEVYGQLPNTLGATVVGSINWVQYHRWVSDQCPVPPMSLQITLQDYDHWLESGALLTQRKR